MTEIEKAVDALFLLTDDFYDDEAKEARAALLAAITRREAAVRAAAINECADLFELEADMAWSPGQVLENEAISGKIRALIKEQP